MLPTFSQINNPIFDLKQNFIQVMKLHFSQIRNMKSHVWAADYCISWIQRNSPFLASKIILKIEMNDYELWLAFKCLYIDRVWLNNLIIKTSSKQPSFINNTYSHCWNNSERTNGNNTRTIYANLVNFGVYLKVPVSLDNVLYPLAVPSLDNWLYLLFSQSNGTKFNWN